jgi:UDP-N-acetylmuramate dehydrogenase
MTKLLISELDNSNIPYQERVSLSNFTYLQTGGMAKLIIYPRNIEETSRSVIALNDSQTPYKIIGATTNLLFCDDDEYSCLLCTSDIKDFQYDSINNQFVVGSGVMLPDLSRYALYHSITGFEGLEGIPGTVGGAVFMNAGAYGYRIKDNLLKIEIVDEKGLIVTLPAEALSLQWRNSALRTGKIKGIVTRCFFKTLKGDATSISNKMEVFHAKRHKYQDFLYPNLGSIFSGSIYNVLGQNDIYYKIIAGLYYLFLYKWKIFVRESPMNRKWLNDIVVKRFNLQYDRQPFSDKTINCLVNRGQGTDEMIRYIEEIKLLTKGKIPVENEIVRGF